MVPVGGGVMAGNAEMMTPVPDTVMVVLRDVLPRRACKAVSTKVTRDLTAGFGT